MARFVLVHSPVTGPSTWRWVAAELAARGHQVVVPAVPPAATSLGWPAFVGSVAALAGTGGQPIVAGHSGAGPLLPVIGARLGARRLVFVDADIPPESGSGHLVPEDFLAELRRLAVRGRLPPWSQWFGPEVMRELIPDDASREIVSAELPSISVSYFEDQVQVPSGWTATGCGYVLLSKVYAAQAARAEAAGWPVARFDGAHLDLVTRPRECAQAILSVSADGSVPADGRDG